MKVGDKVEKNGEFGIVMSMNAGIALIWWNVVGKYNLEPCNITSLNRILEDTEVDDIVQKEELGDDDIDQLTDWVLSSKSFIDNPRFH